MQSPLTSTHLIFIDGFRLMLWKFYLSNKQFRFHFSQQPQVSVCQCR